VKVGGHSEIGACFWQDAANESTGVKRATPNSGLQRTLALSTCLISSLGHSYGCSCARSPPAPQSSSCARQRRRAGPSSGISGIVSYPTVGHICVAGDPCLSLSLSDICCRELLLGKLVGKGDGHHLLLLLLGML
jgi:hypothetical protein